MGNLPENKEKMKKVITNNKIFLKIANYAFLTARDFS